MGIGLWVGRPAGRPHGRALSRAVGARDLAIGAGLLTAIGSGRSAGPWLLAGLIADTADLTATLADRDGLPPTAVPLIGAFAGAGIALGLVALVGEARADRAPVPA